MATNFNQPVNISLQQDYNAMDLSNRNYLQRIIQRRKHLAKLSYLTMKQSDPRRSDTFLLNDPFIELSTPNVQCASAVLSNGNKTVTVTLSGSGKDILATGYQLVDSVTGTFGTITSHTATTVVMNFYSATAVGTTAFTASDFAGGNIAVQPGAAAIGYSDGRSKQSQYVLPQTRQIQISTHTASVELSKKDMVFKNRIERTGKNGKTYFSYSQVDNMLDRFANGYEYKLLVNNQVIDETGEQGASFSGLHGQIINEGGLHMVKANLPGEAELQQIANYIRSQSGGGADVILCPGSDAIANIYKDLGNKYIPYAGTSNTFGVKMGTKFTSFPFNGVTIHIMDDYYDYDNNQWFPATSNIAPSGYKQQGAMLVLDASAVSNKLGAEVPFLTNFYYGLESDVEGGAYQIMNGGNIDQNGAFPKEVTGDSPLVTYMIHGTAAPTLTDPTHHVLYELQS